MIYGKNRFVKHYISVLVLQQTGGMSVPITILWDDGRSFDMQVLRRGGHRPCEKTPGFAVLYVVSIKGKTRKLWHDEQGWFVEAFGGMQLGIDPRKAVIPE